MTLKSCTACGARLHDSVRCKVHPTASLNVTEEVLATRVEPAPSLPTRENSEALRRDLYEMRCMLRDHPNKDTFGTILRLKPQDAADIISALENAAALIERLPHEGS